MTVRRICWGILIACTLIILISPYLLELTASK